MSDNEQVDLALIIKALVNDAGYENALIIRYNKDTMFDFLSLLNEEGKTEFTKEDAEIILTILRYIYNEIAMEYGYMRSFNA
jgi:signal-transduction protein with cAMP-binding, CBS, and nucleotidyltransferase domain